VIHCPGCDYPISRELAVCDLCFELLPDGLKLAYAAALLDGFTAEVEERIAQWVTQRIPP